MRDSSFLKADITEGQLFILGVQIGYAAEAGETFKAPNGEYDARPGVGYLNGTQSNLLLWSLQRAPYKEAAGRRITEPSAGPLFAGESEDGNLAGATIYVLRGKSDNPIVTANHDVLHELGVTGGNVSKRIVNAKLDPTFVLAEVDIVATYEFVNINRIRLENLIHVSSTRHGSKSRSRAASVTREAA